MAGGHAKFRHLSRKSSHRQALLRNMVTSLIEHESISTTYPKAKEAQRLAEKMITWGKKDTEASRRRAMQTLYRPHELISKLTGPLRERYLTRPGGYTRVLRIEPLAEDQAPSAILELVDSPKDMRFAMTAMSIARQRLEALPMNDITLANKKKVLRYRGEDGERELEELVGRYESLRVQDEDVGTGREVDGEGKVLEKGKAAAEGEIKREKVLEMEPRKRSVYLPFDDVRKKRGGRTQIPQKAFRW